MSLEKVSSEVQGISTTLKGIFPKLEGNSIVVTKEQLEATPGLLPEGISFETVKSVQGALLNLADGASLALGEVGLAAQAADKSLDSVTLKMQVGTDEIVSTLQRAVQRRNPESGEEFTRHGALTTRYVTGIGAKRGNYKKIQSHIADEATALFAK